MAKREIVTVHEVQFVTIEERNIVTMAGKACTGYTYHLSCLHIIKYKTLQYQVKSTFTYLAVRLLHAN